MRKRTVAAAVLLAFAAGRLFGAALSSGEDARAAGSFLSDWQKLDFSEKRQRVVGYLQCWRDTAAALKTVTDRVKTDPSQAEQAMRALTSAVDAVNTDPDRIVFDLDAYFAEAGRQKETLREALSAVRPKDQAGPPP